jgi:hypothetical protein
MIWVALVIAAWFVGLGTGFVLFYGKPDTLGQRGASDGA